MWIEAALTWQRRGGGFPSLLHENGTTIGEIELRRAGARVELLYLSDRVRRHN